MGEPARRARTHQRVLPAVVAPLGFVAVLAVLAVVVAVPLAGIAATSVIDEGAVPPASHLPDVPADAEVLRQEKERGSGGCWWELRLDPGPGQSAAELAAAMGVDDERRVPSGLLSLREAYLGSRGADDELHVYLAYEDPFR